MNQKCCHVKEAISKEWREEAMSSMNIYQRLSKISTEITNVSKNLVVRMGNGSYKAVSEGDVLAAVKPLEEKYGVYSYPIGRKVIESAALENNGRNSMFLRIETTYRFVNMENPTEYIDVVSYGDGVDPSDKASGKAQTYSDKYALLKAYKIITGEDPDQYASEEFKKYKQVQKVEKVEAPKTDAKISKEMIKVLEELQVALRIPNEKMVSRIKEVYKVDRIADLSLNDASDLSVKLAAAVQDQKEKRETI